MGHPGCLKTRQDDTAARSLSLREALGQSINTVSAQLIKKTRAAAVIKYAHDMGIESKDLPDNPTLMPRNRRRISL